MSGPYLLRNSIQNRCVLPYSPWLSLCYSLVIPWLSHGYPLLPLGYPLIIPYNGTCGSNVGHHMNCFIDTWIARAPHASAHRGPTGLQPERPNIQKYTSIYIIYIYLNSVLVISCYACVLLVLFYQCPDCLYYHRHDQEQMFVLVNWYLDSLLSFVLRSTQCWIIKRLEHPHHNIKYSLAIGIHVVSNIESLETGLGRMGLG